MMGTSSAHKQLGPCTSSSRMGARSCRVPCASPLLPRAVPHTQEGEWDRCANGGQVQPRNQETSRFRGRPTVRPGRQSAGQG